MEVSGRIKVIGETQTVSDKLRKREFVVTTDHTTMYPQFVSFVATQDKCNLLDNLNEGDEVNIQFNLKGRLWNSPQGEKYFNSLEIWRITKV